MIGFEQRELAPFYVHFWIHHNRTWTECDWYFLRHDSIQLFPDSWHVLIKFPDFFRVFRVPLTIVHSGDVQSTFYMKMSNVYLHKFTIHSTKEMWRTFLSWFLRKFINLTRILKISSHISLPLLTALNVTHLHGN